MIHNMKHLVLASKNPHKLEEIKQHFSMSGITIASLSEHDIKALPEETGNSYRENAYQKAHAVYQHLRCPVLADDSGLEVKALNFKPGVLSARYVGEATLYTQKMKALLEEIKDTEDRTARFVCEMVLIVNDSAWIGSRGEIWGVLAPSPRGTQGFGYDPIFIPEGFSETFGELGERIKKKISHRSRAIHNLLELLHQLSHQ